MTNVQANCRILGQRKSTGTRDSLEQGTQDKPISECVGGKAEDSEHCEHNEQQLEWTGDERFKSIQDELEDAGRHVEGSKTIVNNLNEIGKQWKGIDTVTDDLEETEASSIGGDSKADSLSQNEMETTLYLPFDNSPGAVHKAVLTAWNLTEVLLFAGLTFGWPLILIMLKADGVYSDLCFDDENQTSPAVNSSREMAPLTCQEQDERLNLVFTVATFGVAVTIPVNGQVLLRRGVRVSRIGITALLIVALVSVAFTSRDIPWLVFPGVTCLAAGGIALLSVNMQVAYLYGVRASIVVSLHIAMHQASSSLMILIKYLFDWGVSRQTSFLWLAGMLLFLTSINTIWLSPITFFGKPPSEKIKVPFSESPGEVTWCPPLRVYVTSWPFLSHVLWVSLLHLRWSYFVSSFNTWISALTGGSHEDGEFYADVNLYIQLCGTVTCLLCGFAVTYDRRRCQNEPTGAGRNLKPAVITQTLGSMLAVAATAVSLVPSTRTVVFAVVLMVGVRNILYVMFGGYIQMLFPVQYFGFALGVTQLVSGLFSIIQYPLFIWIEKPDGIQRVYICLLVLMVITLAHPLYIWITCRRAEKRLTDGDNAQKQDYEIIRQNICCGKA